MKNSALKFISPGILIFLTTAMSQSAPLLSQHDQPVAALLARMTLDEKIGQMVQVDSGALKDQADVQKYFLGSVLSGGSSDPATGNTAQDMSAMPRALVQPGASSTNHRAFQTSRMMTMSTNPRWRNSVVS